MATMSSTGNTVINLADGVHNGWTSSSPTTGTTMETELLSAFSSQLAASSDGEVMIIAIGRGIDDEITLWTASWNSTIHTHDVTQAAIESNILALAPFSSNAVSKLALEVSTAFFNGFGQEVG